VRASAVDWLIVAGACVVGAAGFFWRGNRAQGGDFITLSITLTPDDRRSLGCGSDRNFGEATCAYTLTGAKKAKSGRLIVPVVTTSRAIYLVSNLFEQATLRKAFERGGPRFVAVCRAKLREPSGAVGIRFARSGPFDMQSDLWVADIQSCVGP